MIVGLLKEAGDERRVALLPESVKALVDLKTKLMVESGAGSRAYISDESYKEVGAEVSTRENILQNADVIVSIGVPSNEDLDKVKEEKVILAVLQPLNNKELVTNLLNRNLTSFSMDSIPRTSRAQTMDVLSSMATVAGYQAVLRSAVHLPKFFPMFMTAAGTITPAKVLILGAGVAGLQAVATARKLGAVVEVFDVRAAVKEEVESLGGKFVEVEGSKDEASAGGYAVEQDEEFKKKQKQVIHDHAVKADVIICTAQIPGRTAPLLITKETVDGMKPGSVIVDLAASSGGNCEVTKNDVIYSYNDNITVIGDSNLPSTMPTDASKMFGKNVVNFMKLIIDEEGNLNLNFEDDIVKGTCITHNKEIYNEKVKDLLTQNA
ncbi:MAG: Re/Si-specific NAD(P)(+) transhydrogenase subunit alpha [Bacteroidetes bacterium]|nr:Re/Si-specific NAD(P)(+) transhydrogenase subunit alpha [Bacteroidota bacterium]